MKLSTKTRYGLRILIQIALEKMNGKRLAQGKFIAGKQDITEAYLEQIMIPLKHGGIVGTVRGCNGGYELRKPPEEITVLEIIELFDGEINFADCQKGAEQCRRSGRCFTRGVWSRLAEKFREEAAAITVASIIEDYTKNAAGDYII